MSLVGYLILLTAALCWTVRGAPAPEIACYAESVANGAVVKDKDVYREGDIIELKCNRGFKIEYEPDEPRKCTAMGWSPSLKCIRLACDRPVIENGRLFYYYLTFPQRINRELDYVCKDGFLPPEKSYYGRITCTEDGWSPEPKCLKTCSNDDIRVENADLGRTLNKYVSGEKVQYRCNPGLTTPDGKVSGEIECLPNGKFSPGKCLWECKMSNLDHGSYQTDKNIFEVGEYLRYTCDKGFRSPRNRTTDSAQCLQQGWSVPPQCVEITCSIKSTVKKVYKDGDTVQIGCPAGYTLRGSEVSQCYYYGWDPPLPTCEGLGEVCNPPPTVENGDITDSRQPSYRSGSVVEYKCQSYYKLEGNRRVKCENGVWDDPPICLEPCTAGEREMRANNIQLRWTEDKKLYSEHDDEMIFGCLDRFEPSPSAVFRVKCNRGVLLYPKCIKRGSCLLSQETMETNSIFINRSTEIEQGETIEFKCNEGMVPENTLTATCQKKTIIYPKCTTRKKCMSAPVVANGKLKTEEQRSYDSGASVEFECREDTVLAGSINVKCDNGQWSEPPQCLASCKISKEELGRKNVELQLSEDMSKTHKHGSEVNFKCKSGSNRPNRPASLKGECSNGKMIYPRCFTGQTCRLYQEKVDENFLELDPIHDNEGYYGDGEIVQFICKQGFYSHSALKGNCTKGELTYPECKRKNACYINQEILDKHNLELSTSQQHRKYFASSTKIIFTCKPGYEKKKKTIIKKCEKGVIMYPEFHCRSGTSV